MSPRPFGSWVGRGVYGARKAITAQVNSVKKGDILSLATLAKPSEALPGC
ncbi:MAG: hypothetical protein MUC50_12670 [Myxococcota bacterium]|nr:hypothetical protein [Myxococcota bacterium]